MTEPQTANTGFDNSEAAKSWSRDLRTITGLGLHVRPATPADRVALNSLFDALTPEDIYFRFFSPLRLLDKARLDALTRIDDPHTIDFLAFSAAQPDQLLASAMLAADPDFRTAEVALAVRADMKHRGISWTLLEFVSDFARKQGIAKLCAVHSGEDSAATELEREAGFRVRRDPQDVTLWIAEKDLTPARTRVA
jgi:acetyltransferase